MGFDKKLELILSQPEGQFAEFKSAVSSSLSAEVLPPSAYEAVRDVVDDAVDDVVKQRLADELILLVQKGYIRRPEMEEAFKISFATAQRDIAVLKKIGLIRFEGAPKTGRYVLTEKGKKMMEELGYGV